ncbi:MAG: mannose-1-phosphate guanylyltransferase/mannose-6-phosphate isomerase [Pseudomonadota bacterium]
MIQPVILSGGSGTRLWPLSREHYPKQLLPLYGNETLLQQTVMRIGNLKGARPPIVVCNEEHRFLIGEQLLEIGVKPASLILEPAGRNTAPALTLAALSLPEEDRKTVLLVMPADHVIRDNDAFLAAVSVGASMAEQGYLVTFGIVPTSPETGYGYIKLGAPLSAQSSVLSPQSPAFDPQSSALSPHDIVAFVEKPNLETAESYLSSGGYLWNSGMFMLRADLWLTELGLFQPDILQCCEHAIGEGRRDGDFHRVGREPFLACPGNSIDYAVMEKTDKAMVVPLDAGWSDIGAWPAIWEISDQDENGNVMRGDVLAHDTKDSYLLAQHRLLATVGIKDLIVAETADAVLVVHKDKAQDVKAIVNLLKQQKRTESLMHRRVHRPWGTYEGVDIGDRFQVKRLVVKPGAALSLQLHHHRAEHWVVVKGTAKVTRGDEIIMLSENESTFIPLGTKHRLENPGNIPLEIIEVQSGGYLGEDDIVRFDDHYDRHKN